MRLRPWYLELLEHRDGIGIHLGIGFLRIGKSLFLVYSEDRCESEREFSKFTMQLLCEYPYW